MIAIMSDAVDNLVLEQPRDIRMAVEESRRDIKDLDKRVGFLEEGQDRLAAQYAHISTRIDRVDLRPERIETRIGLIEA